jgi:hypothetical protein
MNTSQTAQREALLPASRLRKTLWAIHTRVDTMPKSNKNMGLDMWSITVMRLVREAIELASELERLGRAEQVKP